MGGETAESRQQWAEDMDVDVRLLSSHCSCMCLTVAEHLQARQGQNVKFCNSSHATPIVAYGFYDSIVGHICAR